MDRKKEIILLIIVLIIQTILYICVGIQKTYIHIDEAYSFGLTHYNKVEIKDNSDFYNTWHTKDYYEDYLSLQENENSSFAQVYENQKNDVHPPIYYFLLRIAMMFSTGNFSKWTGIILNIIIYAFITIFSYLIIKELMKDEQNIKIKSAILALASSITLASLSNVVYIRMYALATLNIAVTTFLHIKLIKSETPNFKLLFEIGLSTVVGVLTHYYYLFYLMPLYLFFFVKYIKNRNIKTLVHYSAAIIIAGIISIIIFPYAINHMFFGYRGDDVISNLQNISQIIPGILEQLKNLNYYAFNGLLIPILIIIVSLIIYNKFFKNSKNFINAETKIVLKMILISCTLFFIITSIASPWKVLRYFVPICNLIFIITYFYLYKLLQIAFKEKICNTIIIILLCIMLIFPFIFHLQPELLYYDYKDTLANLENYSELPSIYLYNGGFLNNIMAFTIVDESYIIKNSNVNEENITEIFSNKDISNGIIVFTDEKDSEEISDIMEWLSFDDSNYLGELTYLYVYYLK